jgi:2-methylisocitrate lyase-like PEP mutase family enzyme
LATTSAGLAWSKGTVDGAIPRDAALAHLRELVLATDLPVNADFESGYAADAAGVAHSVRLAVDTGLAGLSIEDSTGDAASPLFSVEAAVERLRAARRAIDEAGGDTLLVARAENFLVGRPDLDDTLGRLKAYAQAGADCLYAPGIGTREQIAAVVAAVAPKPVNLLVGSANGLGLQEIAELGIRRISVGETLARSAWGEFMRTAQSLAQGRFDGLTNAAPGQQLNAFFRIAGADRLARQPAHVIEEVDYRVGEGPLRTIPRGIVEVETTAMDAVITWQEGATHAIAAMPVANFCQYVADFAIVVANKPPLPN